MKCNSKVIFTKKGSVVASFSSESTSDDIKIYIEKYGEKYNIDSERIIECDGEIIGEILAEDNPNYDEDNTSYASLEVNYKCNKCGNTHYPNLPNQYNINDWFNKQLNLM